MEAAVRKRSAAKTWLTRTESKLLEFLEHSIAEVGYETVNFYTEQFDQKLTAFDEAQKLVEELLDENELERDIVQSSEYREAKVKTFLDFRTRFSYRQGPVACSEHGSEGMEPIPFSDRIPKKVEARLPKLDLPTFSGDITAWQSFWDTFNAIIHETDMSYINKFTYLQSLLCGEAASCVAGLALTAENYLSARSILEKRFGRKEKIIFGHIQKMLAVSTCQTNSKDSLWKLYDEIQIRVRSLENLGIEGSTYGVILTPLILHQLPSNIRLEWARVGEGHETDLEFLLTFLHEEITRRERSQTFGNLTTTESLFQNQDKFHRKKPSASALFSNSQKCVFCKGQHYSDKCEQMLCLNLDERKDRIKKMGLCFRCLGHHMARTCIKTCYLCKSSRHHSVLCERNTQKVSRSDSNSRPPPGVKPDDHSHVGIAYSNSETKTTIMQVVRTKIGESEVNIMFDTGSDRSFIREATAKQLGLPVVDRESVAFSRFGEEHQTRKRQSRKVYKLDSGIRTINLIEMPCICSDMYRSAVPVDILRYFENVSFDEDFSNGRVIKIDILIGLDYYWDLLGSGQMSREGITAQETRFGWMLSGVWSDDHATHPKKKQGDFDSHGTLTMFCQTQNEPSEHLIRKMWELDSIGIKEEEMASSDKILENFNKEIRLIDGRYEVKLPWKDDLLKQRLMRNKNQAQRRLDTLSRKLNEDQQLKGKYNEVLLGLEKEGIIHEIPEAEMETNNPVFYLPHRPVVREGSLTTKVRPVFDASAKGENGMSLNDCIETGPNLIPDLIQILIRFRRWKFGLTADITKAFLQIKVNKTDQDVHRFLWDVNGQTRHMRFDRVIFGNACSPFLLNATLKYHLSQFEESRTVEELKNNLYVDDWLSGADTEEDLLIMMSGAELIMKQGSFPLAKWASNSNAARDTLCKSFNGYEEIQTCLKVLGISWRTTEDSFCFETCFGLDENLLFTKRTLLSIIARLFDPLGLLTPYTITLKILFQEAWRIGLDWDEILPFEIQNEVTKWISGLKEIQNWRIPRRLSTGLWHNKDLELISFSDASEKAYGCCVYLKTTEGETCTVTLVMTRVKVAPLKKVTLPRLELLAAVISARMLDFVRNSLCCDQHCKYTCWTDSQIVLGWIKSDPHKWKQFICNRITEIQELTDSANWKHCISRDNPADLLTRGVQAKKLIESSLWMRGPDWLVNDQTKSEQTQEKTTETNQVTDIIAEEQEETTMVAAINQDVDAVMDFRKFGDIGRLIRVMAWTLRFIHNVNNPRNKIMDKSLTSEELNKARKTIIMCVQKETYTSEIEDLKRCGVVNKRSPISRLSPFIGEDGFIRIKGRLDFASGLLYDEKHPILLPKCHISYLLVKSYHGSMKHAGVNTLITSLRNKYWIVSVRTLAKKVCRQCINCQRQDARAHDQVTAPLPRDRTTKTAPFSVIGVDHAGPLFCMDTGDKKMYILIFTCAVTRAVHLELVNSLSLNDFTMAFRRFSARRGLPTVIYSDNARTFKGAERYLQRQLGHVTPTWKFNAPRAPWWGGWWERLIRSTKSALRKTLGKKSVPRTELETTLHEVEACINSRPLTYVEETKQPLTPSHFLIGRGTPLVSVEIDEDTCLNQDLMDLQTREEQQQNATDMFWNIWKDEYIRNLPPLSLKKVNNDLKIGSLVLIREEGKPRLQWPLGIITRHYPGRDGHIRAVELKTAKGVVSRAVQKLHKLEIACEDTKDTDEELASSSSQEETTSTCAQEVSDTQAGNEDLVTTRGRVVKPRKILDL